jgi:ubiquinone/menaquinone biosynthesis C-methylase UbiE
MQENNNAKEDNVISDQYKIGAYFYDAIVFFFQLFVGGSSKWRKSVVDLANPLPNEKILELCCGTGAVSLRISKKLKSKVYASDLSSDQIRVAKWKAKLLKRNIDFSVQDASNTSYPTSFFNKVIISGALHEIKKERRLVIYHEIRRLLKDNGTFIASEPDLPEKGWGRESFEFMFGKWNREHETVYELVKDGLENELADVGFVYEKYSTSNFSIFKSQRFRLIENGK